MQEQVTSQLLSCTKRLAVLPPVVAEPTTYVLNAITEFSAGMQQIVRGDPRDATLVQKNRGAYEQFKKEIRATAPLFVPAISESEAGGSRRSLPPDDESDKESESDTSDPTGSRIYLDDIRKHIEKHVILAICD